jgi:hypothetical protein
VPCLDIDIVEFRTKAAAPASSSGGSDSSSDSDDSDSDSDSGKGWDEFEDFTVNLMLRCNIALLDSFRQRKAGNTAADKQQHGSDVR